MSRPGFVIAALFILSLAVAPTLALARAGSSGSMGSRGSMTFSAPPSTNTAPNSAMPMQRSMTPSTPQSANPSVNAPSGRPTFGGGFMSGLMGGLIGAGIGGMLFGHGFFGGMHGFGFLGFLLQVFLIFWLCRVVFRMFFGRSAITANGGAMFTPPGLQGGMPTSGGGFGGGAANPPPINIGPQDYQQFEQLLQGIQAAWTARDMGRLQAMATPEMVGYFNEQLSDQASRGVRNSVTNVVLQSGDIAQAWAEPGREYATVAMRFGMIDVTYDTAGRVVDGSPTEHVTATELWTFLRAPGGRWVLSAIQQAR